MRTICHWIIRFTQTEANICITIGPIYVIAVTRFTARYRPQMRSVVGDSYEGKVPVVRSVQKSPKTSHLNFCFAQKNCQISTFIFQVDFLRSYLVA